MALFRVSALTGSVPLQASHPSSPYTAFSSARWEALRAAYSIFGALHEEFDGVHHGGRDEALPHGSGRPMVMT